MTLKMKQRVVGSLVMLALLAIFLPMFFSSPHPSTNLTLSQKTPTEPAKPQIKLQLPLAAKSTVAANKTAMSVSLAKEQAKVLTTPPLMTTIKAELNAKPSMKIARAVIKHKKPAVKPVVKLKRVTKPVAKRTVKKAAPAKIAQTQMITKHAVTPVGARVKTWVLQLASFSRPANAEKLMNRLKTAGFNVYTRKVNYSDGRSSTRVFVGPEASRFNMEKTKLKLDKLYQMKGYIRRQHS